MERSVWVDLVGGETERVGGVDESQHHVYAASNGSREELVH